MLDFTPAGTARRQAYGNVVVGLAMLCICVLASSVSAWTHRRAGGVHRKPGRTADGV